ncbi:AAA domain-containing protein [Providencia rettgeri]|uniref:protein kinase domain-containing protein n=1 Tax=Providencia rettgeri TaxID=587 RepID=UPI0034E0DC19
MTMIRFCPHCLTERPLTEIFCAGQIQTEQAKFQLCGWDLTLEPIHPEGWRPETRQVSPIEVPTRGEKETENAPARYCENGHPMAEDDFICLECGADAAVEPAAVVSSSPVQYIGPWRIERRINSVDSPRERYFVTHNQEEKSGVLTLYLKGEEPDPAVYQTLKRIPTDHVPEFYDTGRFENRAWHVTEMLEGGSLSQFIQQGEFWQADEIAKLVEEMGRAIAAFAEHGLRHRNLCPANLLIRSRHPLDIAVIEYGSACLSEFDLDIVTPLDISRYSAPEILAGGVSAASDWWSLGIILLEQLTRGQCFAHVQDNAFLIQVMTNGVELPEELHPNIQLLLRGLLCRDRFLRWQWPQVSAWLQGKPQQAPQRQVTLIPNNLHTLAFAGQQLQQPEAFALIAAQAAHWDEALPLLLRGDVSSWLAQFENSQGQLAKLQTLLEGDFQQENVDDIKLTLALKILNDNIPLIYRGEIITPAWLLENPYLAFALISEPINQYIQRIDPQHWLVQLYHRQCLVRERANQLNIILNEESLRLYLLVTSINQLSARWALFHGQFPDSHNESLQGLFDKQNPQEIDYILLLSADIGQFISVSTLVEQAFNLAQQNDIHSFDCEVAKQQLLLPRKALYLQLSDRTSDFKRVGLAVLDSWVDQFLLMRRLSLEKTLVLLAVPLEHWQIPESQKYILEVLRFFNQKLTAVTQRGNLVRMRLTPNTGRIDLTECGSVARSASALLEHLLNRKKGMITIDSDMLLQRKGVNTRLRMLQADTQLYQRDTGINGMYLGFPFLVLNTQPNQIKPRIAPLFLWPIALQSAIAQQSPLQLGFDHERGAVRLNPALASFAGIPAMNKWQSVLEALLSKAGLSIDEIMESLSALLPIQGAQLLPLPSLAEPVEENTAQIVCSAVLFHTSFIGQAMSGDLQQIAHTSIAQTALSTLLNVNSANLPKPIINQENILSPFALSLADPSQERVVQAAQQQTGLLIEGPPGTGKSQTIVSLIADALGRQQTVLVVCQKPAALEVVYKRLVASGLGDRALLINQNQKGRDVILAVREQIEQLWSKENNALFGQDWQAERVRLLSRVHFFEQKLDGYYHALNDIDDHWQLSYKYILDKLIEVEPLERLPLNDEALAQVFAEFNQSTFAQLIDDIKQHAQTWWQLDYEHSALKLLAQFSVNDHQYTLFNQVISSFIEVEKQRDQLYQSANQSITLDRLTNHEPVLAQLKAHFGQQTQEQWQDLSRWLGLFINLQGSITTGTAVIDSLERCYQRLLLIDEAQIDPLLLPLFDGIETTKLAQLSRAVTESMQGSWLRFFNPFYYRRYNQLQQLIAESGLTQERLPILQKTIGVEQQWRLLAQEIMPIYQKIGLVFQPDWRTHLPQLIAQLKWVESSSQLLVQYPEISHFLPAIVDEQQIGFERQCHEVQSAIARVKARLESSYQLNRMSSVFSVQVVERFQQAINQGQSFSDELIQIAKEKDNLLKYQLFREITAHFTQQHWQILATLHPTVTQYIHDNSHQKDWVTVLIQTINYGFYRFVKKQFDIKLPALSANSTQFMADLAELEQAQKQLQLFNRQALTCNYDLTQIGSRREWEEITRLTGPRARRLREFINEGREIGLMQLRPIWLMTPDVASQVLPLQAAMFDSVIYDEASQMPIEFALSTLFRAKQAIVSGDEKQMPPSKFFTGKPVEEDNNDDVDEQQEEADEVWDYRQITDCPDLLHLARTVLPIHTLDIHYRSAYRELINFSNFAFYENRLNIPAQFSAKLVSKIKPLQLVTVNGVYVNQSNEAEAAAVVDHLATLWQLPFTLRPSVGVVTFNQKQTTLINQHIRLRAEQDAHFLAAYIEENQRMHDEEDMSFFVKNVENVQGDERDIILFSTTFGRNAQGTFRRNFGVLGQTGGERRLNVAITRAKQQVVIMTSMPVEEISDLLTTYRKPEIPRDYLQGYLAYAKDACDPTKQKENQKLLHRMCQTQFALQEADKEQSAFVASVVEFIEKNGWQVTKSTQKEVFHFDCIIEDEVTGQLLMGIECDMPSHPLLQTARSRELWRSHILSRVIPQRHRVSIIEWYNDKALAQQRLQDAIVDASLRLNGSLSVTTNQEGEL